MTFSEAAQLALKDEVQELLLTHFSPSMHIPDEYKDRVESIFKNTIIDFHRFVMTTPFTN